jgi:hypothetical protein
VEDKGVEHGLRMLQSDDFSLMSGDVVWALCRFGIISMLSVLIGLGFGLAASFI